MWYVCSLGISDDLINFWDESIKNKMAAAAIFLKNDIVGVIFLSLLNFLDIDGQSLRLRGPAINWLLFFLFSDDKVDAIFWVFNDVTRYAV